MQKLVLGTAKFGMNYGINNKRGKIPRNEINKIMETALNLGVNTFDTAYSYGESEKILGDFIQRTHKKINIISKLPEIKREDIETFFNSSLKTLNIKSFYAYLIHKFESYKRNPNIWNILKKLKTNKKTKKIGFSLYFPSELEYIFKQQIKLDIIQVPFSILDQRFLPYFKNLRKRNIEITVRSVFLQGLVFKKPNELNHQFQKIKNKITLINSLAEENNIPIEAIYLNFALANRLINKVIVGIDGLNHFNKLINALKYKHRVIKLLPQLSELYEEDEKIILPINWGK